jgi:cell wall-associated NlpC family hydrolase
VASAQASVGVKVARSELDAGDLVFFHTDGSRSINHVGIYVGGNQFIHASRSKGITITSMDDSYYKGILSTARRVIR